VCLGMCLAAHLRCVCNYERWWRACAVCMRHACHYAKHVLIASGAIASTDSVFALHAESKMCRICAGWGYSQLSATGLSLHACLRVHATLQAPMITVLSLNRHAFWRNHADHSSTSGPQRSLTCSRLIQGGIHDFRDTVPLHAE
jgi:hypothetical protein